MTDHDDKLAAALDEAILQLGRTTALLEDLAAQHRTDHRADRQAKLDRWSRPATAPWSMSHGEWMKQYRERNGFKHAGDR